MKKVLMWCAVLLLFAAPAQAQSDQRLDYFTRLVKCYQEQMGLQRWVIHVGVKMDTTMNAYAITVWTPYRVDAYTLFNGYAMAPLDDHAIRRVVVHELTHLLTADLYWYAAQYTNTGSIIFGERISEQVAAWPFWQEVCLNETG